MGNVGCCLSEWTIVAPPFLIFFKFASHIYNKHNNEALIASSRQHNVKAYDIYVEYETL